MSKSNDAAKIPPEQEKEILHAVGRCILAWAEVEVELCHIFNSALGTGNDSYVVWDSIISFEAKLKAVKSLVELKVFDSDLLKIWNKLVAHVSKKSRKRNEIAHATLIENRKVHPVQIVLVPYLSFTKLPEQKKLTTSDILARAETFHDLVDALNWFHYSAFGDPNSDPMIEARIKHIPDLVRRLQKTDDPIPEEP